MAALGCGEAWIPRLCSDSADIPRGTQSLPNLEDGAREAGENQCGENEGSRDKRALYFQDSTCISSRLPCLLLRPAVVGEESEKTTARLARRCAKGHTVHKSFRTASLSAKFGACLATPGAGRKLEWLTSLQDPSGLNLELGTTELGRTPIPPPLNNKGVGRLGEWTLPNVRQASVTLGKGLYQGD